MLRQAGDNGVGPLLYHRLTAVSRAPAIPPEVLGRLRAAALQSAAQSLQNRRELGQVLAALHRHGIDVIVLKGSHLGQLVYESSAVRTMCDIDLLVRRESLTRSAQVLQGLGLVPQHQNVEMVDYARHHHLRPMARPGGIRVELHWNIAQPDAPFAVDLPGLWARAQPVELAGVPALVLAPEDLVLHLCLHVSFGHRFRFGLRGAWDVLEVARHHRDTLDWEVIVQRARQWGVSRYVYLTLRLVRELLGAEIPPAALAGLRPPGFAQEVVGWAKTCVFTPEGEASVSPSMAELWTSRRLKGKLAVLWRTLFPSRAAMVRIYQVPDGSRWIHLYYTTRWLDLLIRYGRHAWRLGRGDHRTHDALRAVAERTALTEWLGHRVIEDRG
jgi:hypothetical protein